MGDTEAKGVHVVEDYNTHNAPLHASWVNFLCVCVNKLILVHQVIIIQSTALHQADTGFNLPSRLYWDVLGTGSPAEPTRLSGLQVSRPHPAGRGPAVGVCERWRLDGIHVSAPRLAHRVPAAVRDGCRHRRTLR